MTSASILDVTRLTAAEIAASVATGRATPTEIVEAYIERVQAVEDMVHAWSHLDIEGARATAAELTNEAAAGKLRGPLHGVPFGIKDEFHVAGMPTYFADPEGRPQPVDATPIAKLREAGAIILGKTHMPIDGKTPPTRNPWNLNYTAGGTSSGSGAGVAARMVPIALGEQTHGSNLRPAAYCGLAALKPTFGRISRFGCYQFSWSHDHVGLIGLTMEDIALALSVIAGPDPLDPTTLKELTPPADLGLGSVRPPCVGVVRNFFPERTQPVMQDAIDRAAAKMREGGATVTDVLLPEDFGAIWPVHHVVGGAEASTFHARKDFESGTGRVALRDRVTSVLPASYYLQAQRIRGLLWQKTQRMFESVDALLMGAAPAAAPEGLATTGDGSLLVPWSCLGYPAITLNGGLSPQGLPLGLQMVGVPLAEHSLLQTGAWCEQVLGRLPAPPLG